MRVALDRDRPLRLLDLPVLRLLELRHGLVGLGVHLADHVHVVEDAVGVQHANRAAGRNARTCGWYSQPFWSNVTGSAGTVSGLPFVAFTTTTAFARPPPEPTSRSGLVFC
jgi:hypothetical protein